MLTHFSSIETSQEKFVFSFSKLPGILIFCEYLYFFILIENLYFFILITPLKANIN